MLKSALIFMSGAVVGGSAAALVTFKVLKKRFERVSDEKIKSMQEYVDFLRQKDEAGNLAQGLDYIHEDDDALNQVNEKDGLMKRAKNEDKKVRANQMTDYTSYYKGGAPTDISEFEHPEEDADGEEEKAIKESYEMTKLANSKEKPKIIKASDYEEYEFHDKITLYFYKDDQILTTEDEEIVDDPEALLGDSLTKYGFNTNDESVIYVRNLSRGTDYEVAKVFDAFGE